MPADVDTSRGPAAAGSGTGSDPDRERSGRVADGAADIAERYGLVLALVAVVALFGALRPDTFLTSHNAASILSSQAVLAILTLGLLISLRAGETDLSCAAVMTFAGMVTGWLNVNHGWPILAAIAAALAISTAAGMLNGVIIVYFGIDSFIVTIGTQTLLSGLALGMTNSQTVSGVTEGLITWVSDHSLLTIPLGFWYGLALCLVIWFVFERTTWGARLTFVGQSRSVSRLTGIAVNRVRILSLVATATLSGLAGVVYVGTSGSADPTSGLTYLLPAFAAAFLGSTAITPGRFNAIGAFIAVYFLTTGVTGLAIMGLPSYTQPIFYGAAMLVAVILSRLSRRNVS